MRVGLVCPYSLATPGGVQNHVLGLAGYLQQEGHVPRILAPGRVAADVVDRVGLDPDAVTSAGPAVPVPYNGSVARVNFGAISAVRVRRWLRGEPVDLLHIHEPVTPSIALLSLGMATAPVVATFHTATPWSRTMHVAGAALRPLVNRIAAGVAVSETARLVPVRHLRRDAVVIPNGFGFADYAVPPVAPAATLGAWRGGDHPVACFVGRLDEPRKGLDVLLDAWVPLRARHPTLELVVIGAGRRRLPAAISRLGPVDDATKIAQLSRTDVFVAPHRERESFGIVLLEALASGASVVASDLPAFRDLLAGFDGAAAVFPAGDPAALADAVDAALRVPADARVGRAAAAARYDWKVVGRQVLDVYETVLGAPSTTLA